MISAKINPLKVIFLKYILGCDTTNKVPTKRAAFQNSLVLSTDHLNQFGKQSMTEEMLYLAEEFLVRYWGKSETIATFDELRWVNIAINDLRCLHFCDGQMNLRYKWACDLLQECTKRKLLRLSHLFGRII